MGKSVKQNKFIVGMEMQGSKSVPLGAKQDIYVWSYIPSLLALFIFVILKFQYFWCICFNRRMWSVVAGIPNISLTVSSSLAVAGLVIAVLVSLLRQRTYALIVCGRYIDDGFSSCCVSWWVFEESGAACFQGTVFLVHPLFVCW